MREEGGGGRRGWGCGGRWGVRISDIDRSRVIGRVDAMGSQDDDAGIRKGSQKECATNSTKVWNEEMGKKLKKINVLICSWSMFVVMSTFFDAPFCKN